MFLVPGYIRGRLTCVPAQRLCGLSLLICNSSVPSKGIREQDPLDSSIFYWTSSFLLCVIAHVKLLEIVLGNFLNTKVKQALMGVPALLLALAAFVMFHMYS